MAEAAVGGSHGVVQVTMASQPGHPTPPPHPVFAPMLWNTKVKQPEGLFTVAT